MSGRRDSNIWGLSSKDPIPRYPGPRPKPNARADVILRDGKVIVMSEEHPGDTDLLEMLYELLDRVEKLEEKIVGLGKD